MCKNKETAEKIANTMQVTLEKIGKTKTLKIQKYWKINEYYEIFIEADSHLSFETISQYLASSWIKQDESYTWNYEDVHLLLSKTVRWAELDLINY